MSRPRHLSKKGAEFIARFEGYRPDWYRDAVSVHTIGYGHTGPLPMGFKAPMGRAKALKLLQHDAEIAAKAVRAIKPPILEQTRFDALVSLAFNLGTGILEPTHTIGAALRRRGRRGTAAAFLLYDHAGGTRLPGLTRRRKAEAELWTTGRYE